jgi:hypothetical protein
MRSPIANYNVLCLLCGTEVGHIVGSKFVKHAGCSAPMPRTGGLPRCCHCGGSLYLDLLEIHPAAVVPAHRAGQIEDAVA